jgi:hypothetical protein
MSFQIGPAWIGRAIARWMISMTSTSRWYGEVVWLPVRPSSASYGMTQVLRPGERVEKRY